MRKIKAVALSDLHLGDAESILYQDDEDKDNIIGVATEKIAGLTDAKDGEKGRIEELILLGDIADLSQAEPEIAYNNTRIFLEILIDKVDVKKIVYVIGNHDHHLWVELVEHDQGKKYRDCKKVDIPSIHWEDNAFFKERLELPGFNGELLFTYPNYLVTSTDQKTSFLFHHGHFLSETVLEGMVNKSKVQSLEELENRANWDIELMWWNLKKLDPLKEKFYDLILRRAEYLFQKKHGRGTTFAEDARSIADEYLRNSTKWYLENMCGIKTSKGEDFHFVCGHTHNGGRLLRDDRTLRIHGRFISIWNTGGWIVPTDIWSPDAYIFYIEERSENGKVNLVPNMFKIVAFPESGPGPGVEGDYPRDILRKRLERIGE